MVLSGGVSEGLKPKSCSCAVRYEASAVSKSPSQQAVIVLSFHYLNFTKSK